jgi:hypothetical protein
VALFVLVPNAGKLKLKIFATKALNRKSGVKFLAQRARLWLSPEEICYIRSFKNHKYQITNIKQITMTEIRKSKQCLVREGFGH